MIRSAPARGPARRAAAAVRRALKLMFWAARAPAIRNPPLPSRVESVLFVCKGNICRSPFAALVAKNLSAQAGKNIRCSSAGLRPSVDGRCPSSAVSSANQFGVALGDHAPLAIDDAVMTEHDIVVVMEVNQIADVRRRLPHHAKPIVLLALYDPGPDGPLDAFERVNIPDPFGRDTAVFDRCYRRLDASVRHLMSEVLERT